MGIFRKIAGLFGFGSKDEEEREEEDPNRGVADFRPTGLPRRGFSVPVQVPVERSNPGPVLVPSNSGDGGVQVSHPIENYDMSGCLELLLLSILAFCLLSLKFTA